MRDQMFNSVTKFLETIEIYKKLGNLFYARL